MNALSDHAFGMVQYVELAYLMYELRYVYAGILYLISFLATSASCWTLYWKRMELYNATRQCRLVPVVQAGIVRYATANCCCVLHSVCQNASVMPIQVYAWDTLKCLSWCRQHYQLCALLARHCRGIKLFLGGHIVAWATGRAHASTSRLSVLSSPTFDA